MSPPEKNNGCLIAGLLVGLVITGMIIAAVVAAYLGGQLETGRLPL